MPDIKYKIAIDAEQWVREWAKLAQHTKEFGDALTEASEESKKLGKRVQDEGKGINGAIKDSEKEINKMQLSWTTMLTSMDKQYESLVANLKNHSNVMARTTGELLPQQISGGLSAIQSMKGSILSELPFGGLIGLMFLGGKRDEDIRAEGMKAMRIFQQTSDVGQASINGVTARVRDLGIALGKGPMGMFGELEAASAGFAQIGIDIGAVLDTSIGESITGIRESLVETTMRFDSLWKVAAGTAARWSAQVIRDFGLGLKESVEFIGAFGEKARDAGLNVAAFMSSVMQSSAAMRTQRVDISEVADAQLKLQKIIEGTIAANIRGDSARQAFAGGYAERGMGQVTRGIAGMNMGMAAVLGERIGQQPGKEKVTGLDAMYAFREGFSGKGQTPGEQGIFIDTVKELAKMARENGKTYSEQRIFLEKLAGVGPEGSRAILGMADELKDSGDNTRILAKYQEKMKDSFDRRAEETSGFQRSLLRMQDGIAQIGAGLLQAVVLGFRQIFYVLQSLFGKTETDKSVATKMVEELSKEQDKAWDKVATGFKEIMSGAAKGADVISFGPSRADVAKKLGYQYLTDPKQIMGEYVGEAGYGVRKMLKETGMENKDINSLVKLYESTERKSGHGETALIEKIQKMKNAPESAKKLRAFDIEYGAEKPAIQTTQQKVDIDAKDSKGEPLFVSVIVRGQGKGQE